MWSFRSPGSRPPAGSAPTPAHARTPADAAFAHLLAAAQEHPDFRQFLLLLTTLPDPACQATLTQTLAELRHRKESPDVLAGLALLTDAASIRRLRQALAPDAAPPFTPPPAPADPALG